ncbi:MAG: hypothetical protein NTW03_08535, partial [Verrucomicrobia bacterium]|nr:hypothetical protein [Verrucomicrobiota bacterium]
MTSQAVTPPQNRPSWVASFHTRMARYRNLLTKWWWLPLLCAALGVGIQLVLLRFTPVSFASAAKMIVSIKLSIPEGQVYNEELGNFIGTQAALMQCGTVLNRAQNRLTAQKPDLAPAPVQLQVSVLPKTTIFMLRANGDSPEYTQAFLQSCMEEYTLLKKEMRAQTSDNTVAGLTAEALRLEQELRKCDDELVRFAGSNSVVILQEQGNHAGNYLSGLNTRLESMKFEYELLKALNLDQTLERKDRKADALPGVDGGGDLSVAGVRASSDSDYLKARQALAMQKAEQKELSEYLRPQHPRLLALNEEILRREKLLEGYRQQSKAEIENKKATLEVQIKELEREAKDWDGKVLAISRKTAEYNKIKANSMRIQALYDRLLATMQTLDLNKEINPESVTIMEKASSATPMKAPFS